LRARPDDTERHRGADEEFAWRARERKAKRPVITRRGAAGERCGKDCCERDPVKR